MQVPFLDIRKINNFYKKEITKAFNKVLDSGMFILGDSVLQFEKEYASFNKTTYCIGVGNGLDALIISLKSLNIGKGDEIIVPANTYIASILAISQVGAKPILVEPNKQTYNIDITKIESAITSKTKAILAVNLYGQAAELDKINIICKKNNLYLIEDNAQSLGALCKNKLTGSYGIINATSFYPGKNLGALGDAGAITTNNKALYESCLMYRNYGSKVKYVHESLGVNSRLDEIQAAFLSVKLKQITTEIQNRQAHAQFYLDELSGINDLVLPQLAKNCTSVYHLFVIRTSRRNELQQYLHSNGIGTMIHYPIPPHLQTCYTTLKLKKGQLPITEEIAETCLSIPIFGMLTKQQSEYVADKIKRFYK